MLGVSLAAAAVAVTLTAASWNRVPPAETLPPLAAGNPAFAATMEAHTSSPIIAGNHVDVLLNGDEIFPAKLAAIRGARATIAYAEYFYADGQPAREIAEALADRCRAGVSARILLDGFGTLSMPAEYVTMLKDAGCHVATFRPLGRVSLGRHNNRNHRRILVVDGRLAITGGSGVSDKWTGNGRVEGHWRDTDVRIAGPAVQGVQSAFLENWREATGELLGGAGYFPERRVAGDARVQVIKSSPVGGSYEMHTMYLLAIAAARRSIELTNPYFLPDGPMEDALLAAAARGVRVVALTPGTIDHNVVRAASRRGFGRLLRAGIEIVEYQPALLHAKTMVVDGVWATVGSTNFDNRSFALNDELNVVLYDPAVVARLAAAFADDLRHARRVTYEAWQARGLRTKLLELFVLPIESQL